MTKIRNVYIALHGKLFAEAHEQTQRAHTHVTIYLFANKKRINWRALGVCVCAQWHSIIINIWLHVEIVTPLFAKYRCHFATNAASLFSLFSCASQVLVTDKNWHMKCNRHTYWWMEFISMDISTRRKRFHGTHLISHDMFGFSMRAPACRLPMPRPTTYCQSR